MPRKITGETSAAAGYNANNNYAATQQPRPQAPSYTTYNRTYPQQTHITAPSGPSAAQIRAQQGASAAADARTAAAYAKSLQYNRNWPDQFTTSRPTGPGGNQSTVYNPITIGGPGGISPSLPGAGGPSGGNLGNGLNNSGINLPNINNPGAGGPSGGGSGIPGGGQGGPSPTFKIPTPPKAPGLDTYLRSDAAYQNQLRTFAQALAEFQSGQQRTTASDNNSWRGATRQLGDQKVKDLAGIMNDFASRGMLKSGLYGQGIADYQKTYQNNLNDLNTGHSNALRDLSTANVNFQKDQAIQSAQARSDAAARRAAQFGL